MVNISPILVTGATGFVGAAVARQLLAAGHPLRLLARPSSDRRNIAGLKAEVVEGSLQDVASLRAALAGCAALFHVAADYRLWSKDPGELYRANVDGTRAIMEAALDLGVPRVVYTSSVATLGNIPGGVADEATPVGVERMIGHYKRSKFLAEVEVSRLIAERGLQAVIVNPSTPIGPRDVKPTPTGRIIVEAASGRMPAFVDTGLNFAHVDDVARGHLLAFERGVIGQRYILGGENLDLRTFLGLVARASGRRAPTIALPRRALFPLAWGAELVASLTGREPFVTADGLRMAAKKMYFSTDKAKRELGYTARPAAEAVADAIAWFRAEGYLT